MRPLSLGPVLSFTSFVLSGCAATPPPAQRSVAPSDSPSATSLTVSDEELRAMSTPWGYGLPRRSQTGSLILFTSPFPSDGLTPCEVNRPRPGNGCVYPADPNKAAKDLFNEGVAAFEKEDLSAARKAFLRAFALTMHYKITLPHWKIAGNLGHVELKLGMADDAVVRLEFAAYDAARDTKLTPEEKAVVQARVAALLEEARSEEARSRSKKTAERARQSW